MLWSVTKKAPIGFLTHDGIVFAAAFSPDGRTLASAVSYTKGPDQLHLWSTESMKVVAKLEGHTGVVDSLVFSPDGQIVAVAAGISGNPGEITTWSVVDQTKIGTLIGHKDEINALAFSPDGKILASAGSATSNNILAGGEVKLWSVPNQALITTFDGYVGDANAVAFSPDGQVLATGDAASWGLGGARLWSVLKQVEIARFPDDIVSLVYSPHGEFIATGSWQSIKIWSIQDQQTVVDLRGHKLPVYSLVFSPDGQKLASGSGDGTMIIWDMNLSRGTALTRNVFTQWSKIKQNRLLPNYPNPFNPETWIPFEIARDTNVTIQIFSQSGNLIRTLDLGATRSGSYITKGLACYWNGRSNQNEAIASGTYFYTIQTDHFTATRKMVVLK